MPLCRSSSWWWGVFERRLATSVPARTSGVMSWQQCGASCESFFRLQGSIPWCPARDICRCVTHRVSKKIQKGAVHAAQSHHVSALPHSRVNPLMLHKGSWNHKENKRNLLLLEMLSKIWIGFHNPTASSLYFKYVLIVQIVFSRIFYQKLIENWNFQKTMREPCFGWYASGFRIFNFFHLKIKIKAFHLVYYLKNKGFCLVSLCSIRIRITGLPAVGSFLWEVPDTQSIVISMQ